MNECKDPLTLRSPQVNQRSLRPRLLLACLRFLLEPLYYTLPHGAHL